MTGKQRMRVAWTVMLLVNIALFAILEGYAVSRADPDAGLTLSRYVYDAAKEWPLLVFVLGQITGGLAVHFWWHWDPENENDHRG